MCWDGTFSGAILGPKTTAVNGLDEQNEVLRFALKFAT